MNFYIDFEATQYSERIISIGCIAENGARFETLVKPVKNEKVNAFITQLTGITNEMLESAPTADDAFNAFYDFVKSNNDSGAPTYYCYGPCDVNFIKHTVSGMSNFQAIMFASSIQALLVDYSAVVKNYLSTKGLSLKKLVALIRHVDEVEQKHDALDDAAMLKGSYGVVPVKKGYCDLHDCCEICNPRVRFWCKVIVKIENLQTKIINKLVKE